MSSGSVRRPNPNRATELSDAPEPSTLTGRTTERSRRYSLYTERTARRTSKPVIETIGVTVARGFPYHSCRSTSTRSVRGGGATLRCNVRAPPPTAAIGAVIIAGYCFARFRSKRPARAPITVSVKRIPAVGYRHPGDRRRLPCPRRRSSRREEPSIPTVATDRQRTPRSARSERPPSSSCSVSDVRRPRRVRTPRRDREPSKTSRKSHRSSSA